jgi:hypothetical protein
MYFQDKQLITTLCIYGATSSCQSLTMDKTSFFVLYTLVWTHLKPARMVVTFSNSPYTQDEYCQNDHVMRKGTNFSHSSAYY